MNLSFQLDSQSLPFRLLRGLLAGDEEAVQTSTAQTTSGIDAADEGNPFAPTVSNEATVIPGAGGAQPASASARSGQARGGSGGWRANLSYAHQRPRDQARTGNQMVQGTLTFKPTEKWNVNWRTSYDVANGSFNDHLVRLSRDLHRWEANFDFRKTATGNWSFRFEVSLSDQEDLHFDYSQRSVQDRGGARRY